MKIKEVIVVEGKHDQDRINKAVTADTFVTNGTHLSKSDLQFLLKLNQEKGIIVFTDPDYPGESIRRKIREVIPDCLHATLSSKQSKGKGKVGIEHASIEDIQQALNQVVTFVPYTTPSLSWQDYNELQLNGMSTSKQRRELVCAFYHLPYANSKTCYKYLNMLGIQKSDLEAIL